MTREINPFNAFLIFSDSREKVPHDGDRTNLTSFKNVVEAY